MERQGLSAVSGIKWKEKFAYGMGEVASGVTFGLVQSVLQKYYTDILGIGVISIMHRLAVYHRAADLRCRDHLYLPAYLVDRLGCHRSPGAALSCHLPAAAFCLPAGEGCRGSAAERKRSQTAEEGLLLSKENEPQTVRK